VLTFGDAQGDDEEHSLNMDHGFHSKLPPGILPHGLPTVKEVAPAITPQEHKKEEVKQGKIWHASSPGAVIFNKAFCLQSKNFLMSKNR
jgi:dynein intermediate chain, cytosolic